MTMIGSISSSLGEWIQTVSWLLRREVVSTMSLQIFGAVVILSLASVLLLRLISPNIDPREPPVLWPRVPFIGHVVSLIRDKSDFHLSLYQKHKLPIVTLPMLSGKMYVIYSPTLVTAVMKNQNISLDPIAFGFDYHVQGSRKEIVETCSRPEYKEQIMRMLHTALMGNNLRAMQTPALQGLMSDLNSLDKQDTMRIEDLWDWVQRQTVRAAHEGLFGEKNPVTWEVWEDIRTWADHMPTLALGFAQSTIASKGLAARNRAQEALKAYYVEHRDEHPSTSGFVADRAALYREIGIPDDELPTTELFLPWVSVVNTAPAIMWLLCEVFAKAGCISRVTEEVRNIVTVESTMMGKRKAVIDVVKLDRECRFLDVCWMETMRLYNTVVGTRRVMEDSEIQDIDGRVYLLKKGADIQWTAGGAHRDAGAFGDDVGDWRPDRWFSPPLSTDKFQRENIITFGRGKHICPGRFIATIEAKVLVGVLALGFDVHGVSVPREEPQPLTEVIRAPVWEGGEVRIMRKKGWEDVEWVFAV